MPIHVFHAQQSSARIKAVRFPALFLLIENLSSLDLTFSLADSQFSYSLLARRHLTSLVFFLLLLHGLPPGKGSV